MTKLLSKATPDRQEWFGRHPDVAHFGDYPTLGALRKTDSLSVTQWLTSQLAELSTYSGARNMDVAQLRMLATTVAAEYPWLKVTEFMLFFHRFKAGNYSKFYGAVDPLAITTALKEFVRERGEAWFRRQQTEREERERKEREANPPITWEEYCRRHGINKRNPLQQ